VHKTKGNRLKARGVRLRESTWAELEVIRIRRGHDTVQETVREAVDLLISTERIAPSRAA
jgi:hypothetical protein